MPWDSPSPRQARTVGQPLCSPGSHSFWVDSPRDRSSGPGEMASRAPGAGYTNVTALGVTVATRFRRTPSHGKLGQGCPPVARMAPLCKSEKGAPSSGRYRPGQVQADQTEGLGRLPSLLTPLPGVLAHCPQSPTHLGAAAMVPGPGRSTNPQLGANRETWPPLDDSVGRGTHLRARRRAYLPETTVDNGPGAPELPGAGPSAENPLRVEPGQAGPR